MAASAGGILLYTEQTSQHTPKTLQKTKLLSPCLHACSVNLPFNTIVAGQILGKRLVNGAKVEFLKQFLLVRTEVLCYFNRNKARSGYVSFFLRSTVVL